MLFAAFSAATSQLVSPSIMIYEVAHLRAYLQVHCPLGQAHEVPHEQEQPGAVRERQYVLPQQSEGVVEEKLEKTRVD